MAKKTAPTFSFDEAYTKLQEILETIQHDESIDGLEEKVNTATSLLEQCRAKLRNIENSIKDSMPKD